MKIVLMRRCCFSDRRGVRPSDHNKGIKHGCRSPDAVRFTPWMLWEAGRMYALWHAVKHGRVNRQTLVRRSILIRSCMSRCLKLNGTSSHPDVGKTAKTLLKPWHDLFSFLEYDVVDPTTNAAERGPRPAVMWRKIYFRNRADDGGFLTARLLQAERSYIFQSRNAFQFLGSSIHTDRRNLFYPDVVRVLR